MITQDWQKARIQVAISRAHAWLGHAGEASALEADLEHAELGRVDAVRAVRADASAFDAQLGAMKDVQVRAIEQVLAGGDLDLSRRALETGARLYQRYDANPDRRARVEQALLANGTKLPPQVRIDVRTELAEAALARQDPARALELASVSPAAPPSSVAQVMTMPSTSRVSRISSSAVRGLSGIRN